MSGPIVPPLTVSDVADGGAVTGRPITTLEVTSGTLTVSGRTATLATGGGGGSGTVTSITAAADSGTGTAITTSGTFTFTGSTGITTSVSGTTVTIVADNNGDVTAVGTPVDNQLAVWTSATSIEGDANLTWDGSTLTVAGALDIDNIKIDGNTISSTDTDGAIDLSPDGAGTVTMYNAYRFPTAVTASNDYVLTAQTDGTTAWAAAGGGSVPDPLLLSDGDATDPTYSFSSDTDTGMYRGSANQLAFTTEGTQRIVMSANGLGVQSLGTTAFPSISFTTDSNTGIYSAGADILNLAGGGSDFLEMQHDGTATDFRVGTGSGEARISSDGSQNLIFHTNNGTNSGTITIQQGTNQDLLIEPDGTGVISFYTGANAWTIENGQGVVDQVLTTDGAGAATWEDAGGGSSPNTGGYVSNYWYCPINMSAASGTNYTLTADKIYVVPIWITADMTLEALTASVTTAVGSSSLRLGIYNYNSTGLAGTLLADAGTADSTSTGWKIISGLSTSVAQGHYFLSIQSDSAIAVTRFNISHAGGGSFNQIPFSSTEGTPAAFAFGLMRYDVSYATGFSDLTSLTPDAYDYYQIAIEMRPA